MAVAQTYNWPNVILNYTGWITAECGQVSGQQFTAECGQVSEQQISEALI